MAERTSKADAEAMLEIHAAELGRQMPDDVGFILILVRSGYPASMGIETDLDHEDAVKIMQRAAERVADNAPNLVLRKEQN